ARVIGSPVIQVLFVDGDLIVITGITEEEITAEPDIPFSNALPEHIEIESLPGNTQADAITVAWRIVADHGLIARIAQRVGAFVHFAISIQVFVLHIARSPFCTNKG